MDASGLIGEVATGLSDLLAAGFDPADPAEAAELVRDLEAAARRMHAAQADLLDAIDAKGLHRHDGHASAKVMVRHIAQLSTAEATRRAQAAAVSRDLPQVAAAHRAGEIGSCHVRRLGRVHANRRVRATMPLSEAFFVQWATEGSFRDFDVLVGGWERHVDQDGVGDREAADRQRRDFRWRQEFDGSWHGEGRSPSSEGAEIDDVLEHYTRLEWSKDWAEARERLGDAATTADLVRTDAHRRHDAFVAMCHRAATVAPGVGGGTTTVVTDIVLDHGTFEREVAKLAGHDPGPVDPNDASWRCSTLDGHPVDPATATVQALLGEVRRVVVGADSTVIDLGRRRRLFTGAAALAVRLNDGECIWPGCHAPASGCEIDHLHPWAAGGHTTPANGAPACRRHNLQKQAEGWRVWRDPHGRWQFLRPDGTTIQGPGRAPPHRTPPATDPRSSSDGLDDHDGGLAAG